MVNCQGQGTSKQNLKALSEERKSQKRTSTGGGKEGLKKGGGGQQVERSKTQREAELVSGQKEEKKTLKNISAPKTTHWKGRDAAFRNRQKGGKKEIRSQSARNVSEELEAKPTS